MFAQFRANYPKGSLISELLMVHDGNYVVRVMVQVEGVTLVTGLSASDRIELAEDQARHRALLALGMYGSPVSVAALDVQSPTFELPTAGLATTGLATTGLATTSTTAGSAEPTSVPISDVAPLLNSLSDINGSPSLPPLPLPVTPSLPTSPLATDDLLTHAYSDFQPDELFSQSEPLDNALMPVETLQVNRTSAKSISTSSPTSSLVDKTSARRTGSKSLPTPTQVVPEPTVLEPTIPEPVDMSYTFLQIDDEMDRIGWGREQGRNYLKRTYNKKSRQQLTDEELQQFLAYLRAQPTPNESVFQD